MAETKFHHEVFYPDASSVRLSDIAHTLIAYDKLSPILSELIEELVDGTQVKKLEFQLSKLEAGSLSEAFFVALLIAYQPQLEGEIPEMIEALTGIEVGERFDTLVTVLVLVLVFYGGRYIVGRLRPNGSQTGSRIQGDYNTYVNLAGSIIGATPEAVEQAVENAVQGNKKRTVGRAAIDFFRPAKRDGGGRIQPRGTPEISKETVDDFPNEAALSDLQEEAEPEPFTRVKVEIRATDRDWQKKGWYGIIREDGFPGKRSSMILYPTVDANALAESHTVLADVLVEWDEASSERKLKRFHLLTVHDQLA